MPLNDPTSDFPKSWLLNINGVQCGVYLGPDGTSGGITQTVGEQGRTATVVFQCYWEDLNDLIAGLVGTVDYIGGTITRTEPFGFPLTTADQANDGSKVFPNRTFCTSISSIVGTKWQTDSEGSTVADPPLPGWGRYIFALVTAEFTTPTYLVQDLNPNPSSFEFNDIVLQTYTTSKLRVSGEVFAPPTGSFQFSGGTYSGSPLLDVGASQIRTRFEVSVTRMRMPLVPMQTAGPLLGSVNQDPLLIAGQNFPAETLLFNGINPEPRCDPYNGGIIWDVELQFLGNAPSSSSGGDPLSWNYFLDPGGNWTKVETSNTHDPVFRLGDLNSLFSNTIN